MLVDIANVWKASKIAWTCAQVLGKDYLVLRSPDSSSFAVVSASELAHTDTNAKVAGYSIEERVKA